MLSWNINKWPIEINLIVDLVSFVVEWNDAQAQFPFSLKLYENSSSPFISRIIFTENMNTDTEIHMFEITMLHTTM